VAQSRVISVEHALSRREDPPPVGGDGTGPTQLGLLGAWATRGGGGGAVTGKFPRSTLAGERISTGRCSCRQPSTSGPPAKHASMVPRGQRRGPAPSATGAPRPTVPAGNRHLQTRFADLGWASGRSGRAGSSGTAGPERFVERQGLRAGFGTRTTNGSRGPAGRRVQHTWAGLTGTLRTSRRGPRPSPLVRRRSGRATGNPIGRGRKAPSAQTAGPGALVLEPRSFRHGPDPFDKRGETWVPSPPAAMLRSCLAHPGPRRFRSLGPKARAKRRGPLGGTGNGDPSPVGKTAGARARGAGRIRKRALVVQGRLGAIPAGWKTARFKPATGNLGPPVRIQEPSDHRANTPTFLGRGWDALQGRRANTLSQGEQPTGWETGFPTTKTAACGP